jgi:LCP family protein required for cell wall assembly
VQSPPEDDQWVPRGRRGGRAGSGGGTATASESVGTAADGTVNTDIDLDEIDPKGRSTHRPGSRSGRGGPQSRKKKILKWTSISIASALVVVLALGAYLVEHLTGNIKHDPLLQAGVTQSAEPVDKYGRSPVNILIIGSDARNNAADCKLGGDCGPGANADVEMVVHLSADRSNATVMSIPRDTQVMLPRCTDPTTHTSGGGFESSINTSLQWGPSCTVEAVGSLTGLTIDHFVMVDFQGVVTMSNALGGVPVCVSNKMYDSYSGLRLNAGTTTIQGVQALEFVRTRHGFYDGSDLGREKAQHYFLSAMIREIRANMNLGSLTTLYKIANAATSALTVDDGLSGVSNLTNLAITMNRVPTSRISFVTMPWELDPTNQNKVIVWQSQAALMFQNIKNDVPYSAGSSSSTSTTTAAPAAGGASSTSAAPQTSTPAAVTVDKAAVRLSVLNGSGTSGRATSVRDALVNDGFSIASVGGNAATASATKLYYPSTRSDSAAAVASALGLPSSALKESNAYSEVTLVIGTDWKSGTTYGSSSGGSSSATSAAPTTAATAPDDSSLLNASTTAGCVTVAPGDIVK